MLILSLLICVLPACNPGNDNSEGTTLESMAPVDDAWRDALPSSGETTTQPPESTTETPTTVPSSTITGLAAGSVKSFGGSGNDMFERVIATSDGGFAAVGLFAAADGDCKDGNSSWGGTKSMLVKYDKDSQVEWKTFLGGDGGVNFNALAQLADKGYVIACDTKSTDLGAKTDAGNEGLLVKYSASGKQEWVKIVGGSKNDLLSSIAATPDGGFIAGGKTESSDGDFSGLKADSIKAVLIKFDTSGAMRWKRSLTGSMHNSFEGVAVNKTGDVFAVCRTMSSDTDFAEIAGRGEADTVVMSFEKNGTFKWVSPFSGSGSDELTAITCAPDGGCVIAGKFNITASVDGSFAPYHNAGDFDGFIVKFNPTGSVGWVKSFAGFKADEITGITAVTGGYAAVGMSESINRDFTSLGNKGLRDGFILLINELGKTVSSLSLAGSGDDVPRAVNSIDGTKIFVVGGTRSADLTFSGISPAASSTNFNCFAAVFSTVTS